MAYIGTSPSNGVRRIHTYTATAGQTTFTGSSTEGVTLTYADTNYIDVFQNGVLLGSADYTSTSGTSVVLAQGASVSDLVVIVVYDVFSVADTVSKTAGGTFDSGVTVSGDLTVDTSTLKVDSTNNRVGVGTTSPASELTVAHASGTDGRGIRLVNSSNSQTYETRIGVQGLENTSYAIKDITQDAVRFLIDLNGHVTMPSQPAFLVKPSSIQTNIAVNAQTVVVFGTEVFDQNADFASNTFTAPVAGKYQLNVEILLQAVNDGYEYLDVQLITSNRNHINDTTPDHYLNSDSTLHMGISVLTDMDANDTAYVQIAVPNTGSAQTDIHTYSSFSGYLVA